MHDRQLPATLRFMLAARRCELQGLEALAQTCTLVSLLSDLVHALQRERGFSNLYLGQPQARLLATLDQHSDEARRQEQRLREHLDQLDVASAERARLYHRLAYLLHGLDDLPALRRRIRESHLGVEDASDSFTRLIASLLAVVFEAADTALDPQLTRALVALFNFMQAKELAGQERACGAMGFSRGFFDARQQERMNHLRAGQQRCSETFAQYADNEALQRWQHLEDAAGPVQRLRQLALHTCAERPVDAGLAELWFDLCSERIDAMHTIEALLAEALRQLCRQRLESTSAELDNHRSLSRQLAAQAGHAQPLLFSVQGRTLDEATPDDALRHSLLDLLQEQSSHLQRLGDELKAARSSLAERKRIEQAKRLLMSRYQLDEQSAHDRMQRTAMNQGLRLIDLAERLLAQEQGAP
ncbi:nitrate- and nitrite sensing domain-containing protein [Pseudomonas sp. ABC1]|uniref:nitrate regulatory protein n=1 Tax=Pseudomonas sp. ABC1 TaxID=2748080 RepID=UPI0015C33000|nr:nitrate regulatory protein [Pseudomonas sp. ABC1]QLF92638.1 nitrate- and nitrite sensing domain-containing protein [Pseudomonas sp. ABC1]